MRARTIFILFFIFLSITSYSQIDSIKAQLKFQKKNKIENKTTINLSEQIYQYYKISRPDSALKYAYYGLTIAEKLQDSIRIASLNKKIGDIYFNCKIYYQAMEAFFKALTIYQEKELQKEYAYSLIDIANTHFREGINNTFALNYYNEAISIFEQIKDNVGLSESYDKISLIYSYEKNYTTALNKAVKSLRLRQKIGDNELIAKSYFDIAKIYKEQGNYEQALNYFEFSIIEYGSNTQEYGNIYFQLANTYLLKKDYERAIKNFNIALNIFKMKKNDIKIAEIYNQYAKIYFILKEYIQAISFAQKSLLISENNSFMETKQNAYLILSNIYSEKGEIELALRSYQKYSEIRDSIFANKTQDKYTELQVSIKTQLQDKHNKLLQKEQEYNELKNKQQKFTIYIFIILAISLLGLSLVFLRMFHQKRKDEERLTQFAEVSQIGIAIHDGTKILEVNNKFCQITQFKRNELIGWGFLKLIRFQDHDFIKKQTDLTKKEFYELIHLKKDGSTFLAEVYSEPFVFRKKNVKVVSLRDITNIRKAAKKLKETQLRYKTLLDASPDGVVITDKNGIITYVSKAIIELFETESEITFINKKFEQFITPSFKKKFNVDIKNIIKGEYAGVSEYIANRKNNEKFYIECNGEIVKGENGEVTGVFLIIRDISERKITENALIESESRFRGLFDNAKDAIIIQNHKNQIVDANPYCTDIFGFDYSKLLEMSFFNLIPSKFVHTINLEKYAKSGEIFTTPAIHKTQKNISIQVSLSTVYFSDKESYLFIIRDITKQKQSEENLKQFASKLQTTNATKDKMFSIIAHDLRGPIGNLKAMMELIIESPEVFEGDEINEILHSLKDSSVNTYELLENLLNWAKTQQNLIEYNPEVYDIGEVIDDSVKMYCNTAKIKNIQLKTETQTKIKVIIDINMLRTILRNLIHNAIKFTKKNGKIIIDYKIEKELVIVSITDTGIGIAQENIDKLFDENQYFTTYGTNQEKGTGIGLPLCKEFVKRNNGTIWVESQINKGTTFFFSVRRA